MNKRAIGLLIVASASSALAQPAPDEATTPCVNREKIAWRQVRDASLDAKTLRYCTGEDCWSLDLVKKLITPIAMIPVSKPALGQSGSFVDHGAQLATATETHVEFCPTGPDACKKFDFKIGNPAVNGVYPVMNDERTLGAVMYRGESEARQPSFVLTYDLTEGKLIKQIKANDVEVLGHGFLIDDVLYSNKVKKLGKLAVPDQGWIRFAGTDLLVLHDTKRGAIVLQDTTTTKVKARIDLDVKDVTTLFTLVASPDTNRLYAIGSKTDEGEVIVIDVANGQLIMRTTPTICKTGTHRVN